MARNPKPIETARANLEASIPLIPGRYQEGVSRAEWAKYAGSDQAETNFGQRMQQVISSKSRQAGVRRAGDQAWKTGALDKGVSRIGSGVQSGLDKYARNFGTVYAAITRTVQSLPARGIDPMANIDKRLKPVVQAAMANKVRGRGS